MVVSAPQRAVIVRFTKDEMLHGAMVGCTRQIDNAYSSINNAYAARHSFDANVLGALGEMAVAKHFGLYWSGNLGNFKAKDVGGAQVRATDTPDGCLIVHPPPTSGRKGDKPDDPFIFVRLEWDGPTFWLCGWMTGRDCQRLEYWREQGVRHPAYFVPAEDLWDISSLRLPWKA